MAFRIIKELKNKSDFTMNWIGIIIIALVVSLYLYYNPHITNEKDMTWITGGLTAIPEYQDNGDNPGYISIYLSGYEKMFKLSGCGLDLTDRETLFNMSIGDRIKLFVNRRDFKKKPTFWNKTVGVKGIELSNGNKLLTLSMLNNCEKHAWERLLRIAYICGIILIAKLIFDIVKLLWKK